MLAVDGQLARRQVQSGPRIIGRTAAVSAVRTDIVTDVVIVMITVGQFPPADRTAPAIVIDAAVLLGAAGILLQPEPDRALPLMLSMVGRRREPFNSQNGSCCQHGSSNGQTRFPRLHIRGKSSENQTAGPVSAAWAK